jgi:ketosteroid isomerase-like protein
MSDLQLVTDLYAAFDRGDLDAIRPLIAPDFVMTQPNGLPWSGRYAGPDGFFEFIGKLYSHLDTKVEVEEIYDAGGSIVQVGHTGGTVRANGAAFRAREVQVVELRDGLLVRFQVFVDVPVMRAALETAPKAVH